MKKIVLMFMILSMNLCVFGSEGLNLPDEREANSNVIMGKAVQNYVMSVGTLSLLGKSVLLSSNSCCYDGTLALLQTTNTYMDLSLVAVVTASLIYGYKNRDFLQSLLTLEQEKEEQEKEE